MEMEQKQMMEGTVLRVVFRNDDTGYTVLSLDDGVSTVTAVGVMPGVYPDMQVRLRGSWTKHPRYGHQFEVEQAAIVPPSTEDGIAAYLASGLVRDVGPSIARSIVRQFGVKTIQVLDGDDAESSLREVNGVGPARASSIVESWREHRYVSELMMFLQSHGITTGLAMKIYRTFEAEAMDVVRKEPYRLTEIIGIGFVRADRIARTMGIPADAPARIQAGVLHALGEQEKAGSVYAPRPTLIGKAAELLQCTPAQVIAAVSRLAADERIRIDGDAIYSASLYDAEVGVAERLRLLTAIASRLIPAMNGGRDLDDLLLRVVRRCSVELSPGQREAVQTALTHKVTVLTGGPGTGKTTVVRTIVEALELVGGCRYALCAPTGRAAKRLSEATGREAQTIHRLLEFAPGQNDVRYDELFPLPVDFLIVDEASMLDLRLTHRLLKAVDLPTHVLLVGDVDQLPSVGAGSVLHDVIGSGLVSIIHLDEIFRQAADSGIIVNAHRINRGDSPICNDGFRDFYLFAEENPAKAADLVVDVVARRIPRKFGLSPDSVQVIAPMYKGASGIDALNQRLQAALNPPTSNKVERRLAHRVLRVGDRVMQTRNNYDKEVFNGDVGRITAIDLDREEIVVQMDGRVVYNWSDLNELTHAYAVSVHKSQGSEYDAVVMPVLSQHYVMLRRNLLYTAITRAKRLVVLVGTRQAIAIAVRNDQTRERYSGLLRRLRDTTLYTFEFRIDNHVVGRRKVPREALLRRTDDALAWRDGRVDRAAYVWGPGLIKSAVCPLTRHDIETRIAV